MYKPLLLGKSWWGNVWKTSNKSFATLQAISIIFDSVLSVLLSNGTQIYTLVHFFLFGELVLCTLVAISFLATAVKFKEIDPQISKLAKYFAIDDIVVAMTICYVTFVLSKMTN